MILLVDFTGKYHRVAHPKPLWPLWWTAIERNWQNWHFKQMLAPIVSCSNFCYGCGSHFMWPGSLGPGLRQGITSTCLVKLGFTQSQPAIRTPPAPAAVQFRDELKFVIWNVCTPSYNSKQVKRWKTEFSDFRFYKLPRPLRSRLRIIPLFLHVHVFFLDFGDFVRKYGILGLT